MTLPSAARSRRRMTADGLLTQPCPVWRVAKRELSGSTLLPRRFSPGQRERLVAVGGGVQEPP
jgi:hypothetical protein